MKRIQLTILVIIVIINLGRSQTLNVPENIGTSTNAGKVGIGTTIPASKFSVDISSGILNSSSPQSNYNITLGQNISSATGEGAGIAFTVYQGSSPGNYPSYTPGAVIVHERTNLNSMGKLHFKVKTTTGSTDALTTAMTISDNGNIGNGTTNPVAKLSIVDPGSIWGLLLDNSSSSGGTNPWYIGATGSIWGAGDKKLVIGTTTTSTNSVLTLTSTGSIGIGTTSPNNAKIQIQGNGIYDAVMRLVNTGTNGGDWSLISSNDSWTAGAGNLLYFRGAIFYKN